MTDRPTVTVRRLGGSQYEVSYKMYSPDRRPINASATVKGVLQFKATTGSSQFHDVSKEIPGGINIISQNTNGNTHVVTVKCSTDPTEYFQ